MVAMTLGHQQENLVTPPLAPTVRRGDGRAEILKVETIGESGKPTMVWRSGERAVVKVNETMVTLLTQQLQHARLAEARDVPTVQVLDRAVPAARHSAPKTRLNLTIAGVISIAGGVFSAFALEYVRRVRRGRRVAQ